MKKLICSCCLIAGLTASANTRLALDTVKVPSDTTGIKKLAKVNPAVPPPAALTPLIPPSPQAEAFQRVGDYTLNNASGVPDITLPLYEIDHYGYKIPITLRYIATPLKPGYNYDVTGHGWALTLGSCISRTIKSAPDERFGFKISHDMLGGYYQVWESIFNNYNYQFDPFKAVLPNGTTFQFYISKENGPDLQYIVSNRKHLKITAHTDTGNIYAFTVVDEAGVTYTFDIAESSTDPNNRTSNVAWYLSRINLPNTNKPIYFYYNASIHQQHVDGFSERVLTLTNANEPALMGNDVRLTAGEINNNPHYKTKLLTNISCGTDYIVFEYMKGNAETEFNYLKKIRISNLKEFRLSHTISAHYPSAVPLACLTRLVAISCSSPADSLVYKFTYTSRGAYAGTDHWGYCTNDYNYQYNLANMNFYFECHPNYIYNLTASHLITSLGIDADGKCPYQKFNLLGNPSPAERRHALDPSYHQVLKSITYPTGGRTEFTFENHRFVTATAANGDYIATKRQRRVIEGGGFRIKDITNYTADGKVADIKEYRYGPTFKEAHQQNLNLPLPSNNHTDQHIGYGEPVVDPNVMTYAHFSSSDAVPALIQHMLLGLDNSGRKVKFSNPFYDLVYTNQWRFDVQFCPIFFRNLLQGRNAVVYPEITEYHGDVGYMEQTPAKTAGKTVYKYDIYHNQGDSTYYQQLEYYGHTLELAPHTSPKDYPIEKTDYAYEGFFKILRKETYTYQTTGGSIYDYVFGNYYSPGFCPNAMIMNSLFRSRYLLVNSYLPTGKTITEYTGTGAVTTSETLSYNSYDQLSTYEVTGAKPYVTTYTYPSPSDTGMAGKLVERNMMSKVLQSKTRTNNSDHMEVAGYKTDYSEYTVGGQTLLLPSRLYRLNTTLTGSEFEETHQVLSYTANGNPVETVDLSGMHTFYLWSYGDCYLIAEIRNSSISQVVTAVNATFGTDINGLATKTTLTTANLRNLRSHAALSTALVTTWTYTSWGDVTSQTLPSGEAIYYSYDGLGRLKESYRYEGNIESTANKRILKQYTYHTKTK